MKRFFTRLGRFFWSWGFLKIVLWTVTIVVLFYVEEDWRGARAWAATKAKWEARGEVLDYQKFFAPPIPDARNLGAIPLFRLERVGQGSSSYLDGALQNTLSQGSRYFDVGIPTSNGWIWGDLPEIGKIRSSISTAYAKAFKAVPPSDDPLVQLDALFPFLQDLRAESARRPECRFAYDDASVFPDARVVAPVIEQIALAKLLALHGILALHAQRPDMALADFETVTKLGTAAGRDPSLVGGLVSIGVSTISLGIVDDGLARHAWSEAQLVEIDRVLRSVDFLATYRFSMRSEAAAKIGTLDYYKRRPWELNIGLSRESPFPTSLRSHPVTAFLLKIYSTLDTHWRSGYWLWPSGWLDKSKALIVDETLDEVTSVDDQKQLAYPEIGKKQEAEQVRRDSAATIALQPWNVLADTCDFFLWRMPPKFAYSQTRINEARIACALERYRLAHGSYPASLDLLVPGVMADPPQDVMTGKPYLYRLRPDGTFLLYSVGWNETDEGGTAAYYHETDTSPGYPSPDISHGDWPWPTPK